MRVLASKEAVGIHTHLPSTWKSWKLVLLHTLFPSLSHFPFVFFFFKNNQESHICLSHFLNPVKAPILMLFCYKMKIHLNTYALHPCEASGRWTCRPKTKVLSRCAKYVSIVQSLDEGEIKMVYKNGKKRFKTLTVFHYWKIYMLKSSKSQCKRTHSECASRACSFQESGGKLSFISCFIKFYFEEKQTAKAYVQRLMKGFHSTQPLCRTH